MRKSRKFFALFLSLTLLFSAVMPINAAGEPVIPIYLDGERVDFGITNGVQDNAVILYDFAYVPVAKIIEILTGTTPAWNNATKTASFDFNGKKYDIDTTRSGIYVDGVFVNSATGTPPVILNDRTLIPLKMLTDVMGFSQRWDEGTRSTYLISPPPAPTTPPTTPAPLPEPVVVPPTIISYTADHTTVTSGETINVNVHTNQQTYMVKIMDVMGRDITESKSYRAGNGEHIFDLSFKPAESGGYFIYAGDQTYYEVMGYRKISVTVKPPEPVVQTPYIYRAWFASTEMVTEKNETVTVVTSDNVDQVTFSVQTGGGWFAGSTVNSYYTDRDGSRVFTNTYYAPSSAGAVTVNVTARSTTGNTTQTSIYGNVISKGSGISTCIIYQVTGYPNGPYTPGSWVTLSIQTGSASDVVWVEYNNEIYYATLTGKDDEYNYYTVSFTAGLVDSRAFITSYSSTGSSPTMMDMYYVAINSQGAIMPFGA